MNTALFDGSRTTSLGMTRFVNKLAQRTDNHSAHAVNVAVAISSAADSDKLVIA